MLLINSISWSSPLPKKCPNAEFFLVRIFMYSVRIQENTEPKKLCKNYVFEHFSRSAPLQKDDLYWPKYATNCFNLNHSLTLKSISSKILFSSVYVIGITCFHECFLIHVITGRYYYLYDPIVTLRFSSTSMLLRFLKKVFWNMEIYIFMFERSPYFKSIISPMIPKVKIKDDVYYTKYMELRQDWHFHKK